jgi:hypothetical protein
MPRAIAQYRLNFQRTACTTENTTKSQSAVSNTFHNDMDKKNPYQFKSRRRRPEPTPASFSSPLYSTSYLSRTVKAIC